MNEKLAHQALTNIFHEKVVEVQRIFMSDANSGDETPDQAVQLDEIVDRLAGLLVEIKSQNI